MKKILLSFIAVLLPLMASAVDPVEIGGIYYNLFKKVNAAQVTSNPTPYSGSVVIPSSVTDVDGTTYSVTSIGSSAFSGCSGLTSISIPSTVTTIDGGAFGNCSGLTSITIPNSVKSFGYNAFYNCTNLTSVNITDVAAWCKISFGDNPLKYAHHLYLSGVEVKDLVIPSGVTSISDGAFKGCSGLTSVSIPNSVTSIGEGAFSGSGLTSITIPNGVTEIGGGAFSGCSSLATVILPNSVTIIESYLFDNCSNLTSVTMGNSVYTIGENAFYGCSSLASLTVPNSVSEIGQYAFTGSGLTSFTIPYSMTSIGSYVFSGCSSMTSITIHKNVDKICDQAFYGCNNLSSVNITDLEAWCHINFDVGSNPLSLAHHLYLNGTKIVDLVSSASWVNDRAFEGCTDLHSVTLPNIGEIGTDAFYGCSNITTITLGESCYTILTGAFADCPELTDVYCYAKNVPSILFKQVNWDPSDPSMFFYSYESSTDAFSISDIEFATLHVPAESVEAYEAVEPWRSFYTISPISVTPSNIVFSDANVKAICVTNWDTDGDGELSYTEAAAVTDLGTVFAENTTITSFDELQYFTGLTSLGGTLSVFGNCSGLTSIVIPNNVTTIGRSAFFNCSGLTSVTIPNSVTTIGDSAFEGCSGLTSLTIPDNVTSVGSAAFHNCSGLTSIEIGSGADLGYSCPFRNCGSLTSITVAAGNSKYDSRNNCNALIETSSNKLMLGSNNTIIPNSVTSIDNFAFYNCSGLTSVTIPEGVTSIGYEAFENCSGLTSLTIPEGVTTIGDYAFRNISLTSINIPKSVTLIETNPFEDCGSLSSITVDGDNNTYDSRNNCNAIIRKSDNTLIVGCKNTIIPNTVVKIGGEAFGGSGLTSIVIPDNVKTIQTWAFAWCSNLASVTIPNSVTSIGSGAFKLCTNLTSVTVDIATPLSINNTTFSNSANATLYVPSGSETAYSSADYWKDFKEIQAIPSYESVTITSAGMATYCSANDLDFTDISGIKAYIASGFNPTTGVVFIMHVNEVPANTGIMLKGTPGTYQVPQKSTNMYYVNMFKGTQEAMTVPATSDGYKNYVLGNGSQGLLFYGSNGGSTLVANRAYLQIPLSVVGGANARGFVSFSEDDATGIITPESMLQEEGDIYNLNGQRVVSPKKGLYIRNGKKIIIR